MTEKKIELPMTEKEAARAYIKARWPKTGQDPYPGELKIVRAAARAWGLAFRPEAAGEPDPRDARIAELEARLASAKVSEQKLFDVLSYLQQAGPSNPCTCGLLPRNAFRCADCHPFSCFCKARGWP